MNAEAYSYSRTQESEISQQFPRLPNPDMVMYVFPHLAAVRRRFRATARYFLFTAGRSMRCQVSVRRLCNDILAFQTP